MSEDILKSTRLGIGDVLLKTIQDTKFCIVGCGGVGSNFAEMLVRTGAVNIALIDHDKVELKNLNRTPFTLEDINKTKVEALAKRLKNINKNINITPIDRCFGSYAKSDSHRQEVRDSVTQSDVTIIVVDKNSIRIMCENLRKDFNARYLVIGVEINYKEKTSKYACGWMRTTPAAETDLEDYGENNASYMSIVLEATCVGFNMLLHHLENPGSAEFLILERKYKNYIPLD